MGARDVRVGPGVEPSTDGVMGDHLCIGRRHKGTGYVVPMVVAVEDPSDGLGGYGFDGHPSSERRPPRRSDRWL